MNTKLGLYCGGPGGIYMGHHNILQTDITTKVMNIDSYYMNNCHAKVT